MAQELLAVALCRVSSIEQLENNSLGNQKSNVLKEAQRLGVRIPDDAVWEGAVSSKKGVNYNRKDLKEIEEYCKKNKGVRYLIVQEVDRFMRSPEEQTYWYVKFWHELSVRVWFADKPELNEDTHNASLFRFLEGWRAGGSNEERKNKSINGLTAALKEGRYTFNPKPGYMRGEIAGIHKIHPVSGIELQKVLKRLSSGCISATNALIELNKSKFTENHAPYKMDKFRKIATDVYYAGFLEMDKQIKVKGVTGLHEPIISLAEHNKIVDIFNNKPKYQVGPKRKGNPLFPLNNIIEDDQCVDLKNRGRLVGFRHSNGKYVKYYEKYRCRTCGRYWHKEQLHSKIIDMFDRYEMSSDTQSKLINALEIVWQKDSENRVHEVQQTKRAIKDTESYIERKVESATDDSNSLIKDDILKIIDKKKKELIKLNTQLRKLTEQQEDDRKEFMTFALRFIQDTGKQFLEPYVTKENRLVCKQMLFPAGIYINQDEKVYTPEISVFFRGELKKKDTEVSDNSHLVRVRRL